MLLQIAVVVLGLVGLIFRNNAWIFGGLLGLVMDGYGILTRRLAAFLPVTFYVVGGLVSAVTTGNAWWGILVAAILSQAWEVALPLLPPAIGTTIAIAPGLLFVKILSIIFPRTRIPIQERLLTCPGCGAKGYEGYSDHEPKIFEARGQLRGRSVLRCSRCTCGIFFSVARGFAFGKPERINDEMWQQMCAYWEQHHPMRS